MAKPDENLPSNDPNLTDAEKAALEGFDEDGNETADEAAAVETAAAETTTTDEAPATETVAEAQAPTQQGVPFPTVAAGEARDFSAELKALKEQHGNDEIDDDAYEAARDQLILDRAKYEVRTELSADFAEQAWKSNVMSFLQQPDNAALMRSEDIQRLWQASMQMAVERAAAAGTPLQNDWDILTAGRDLLYSQLGLSAQVAPPAPAPPPQPNRAPDLAKVPPTLSGGPAAAPSGAKHTAETLASQDINDLEQIGAGMTDAQWEELLRSTPGAFVD